VLIDQINEIARHAGRLQLKYFGDPGARRKSGGSLVTDADTESELFIRDKLRELMPDCGFIGEESNPKGENIDSEYVWIVDPIDGTSAFVSELPIWGVSICLTKDQIPFKGTLYFPVLDEIYYTDDGGAYLNGKKLSVLGDDVSTGGDSYICATSNVHSRYKINYSGKIRSLGASVYHMAAVARGSAFGAMLGFPKVWDVAAGLAILECVGGGLFDADHSPLTLARLMRREKYRGPMIACTEKRFKVKTFEAKWVGGDK
jgi:myo-inositol-1(or 4)-monophosphatase